MKYGYFKLYNGVLIPKIGFGTWQIKEGEECYNATLKALKEGYGHIDTANAYGNEVSVGKAIKDSLLKREDVFVTSKLRAEKKGYDVALEEFNKTITNLDLDYLDLYLIHAPRPWGDKTDKDYTEENIQSWKAMEKLYKEGKIKSIGVSNFSVKDMQAIIDNCEIKPMVNQIRYFIGCPQDDIIKFCKENDILVEAYSPLGTGKVFSNEEIINISKEANLDLSKMCIKWCLQHDTLPLPKSVNDARIVSNFDLDFEIDEETMKKLDKVVL